MGPAGYVVLFTLAPSAPAAAPPAPALDFVGSSRVQLQWSAPRQAGGVPVLRWRVHISLDGVVFAPQVDVPVGPGAGRLLQPEQQLTPTPLSLPQWRQPPLPDAARAALQDVSAGAVAPTAVAASRLGAGSRRVQAEGEWPTTVSAALVFPAAPTAALRVNVTALRASTLYFFRLQVRRASAAPSLLPLPPHPHPLHAGTQAHPRGGIPPAPWVIS